MKLSDYRSKYSKKTKQMNVYTSVDFPFVSEDSAKQWLLSIIESNSIFNNQVLLNDKIVELSNDFCIMTGTCEVDGKFGTCSIDRTLKVGEEVKCIPTSKGQIWFIMR